jgi:hypothetical protein
MIYTPDPLYNPEFQKEINGRTKLGPGISLSKFFGGYGDQWTINHIGNRQDRLEIARHLYMQAQAMKIVSTDTGQFADLRLIVAEGWYRAGPNEVLDPTSINYKMTQGQAVVYELIDDEGEINLEKTFDLAVYWKDNLKFEKLILDYDIYDPDGSLNAQIILVMPELDESWNTTFTNEVETRFNNYVQGQELIEVKKRKEEKVKIY